MVLHEEAPGTRKDKALRNMFHMHFSKMPYYIIFHPKDIKYYIRIQKKLQHLLSARILFAINLNLTDED